MNTSTFFRGLILLSLVIALSGCFQKNEEKSLTPYPSIPLWVSTEIGLPANDTRSGNYRALGTEPFWNVEVQSGNAKFSRPGDTDVISETFTVEEDDKWAIIVIRSIKWDFFLNMVKAECSDGMSDAKYPYTATVLVGAETLKGCAEKQ